MGKERRPKASRSLCSADELLVALHSTQTRERAYREGLPVADVEAFEASCLRSDRLQDEMLALGASERRGVMVKVRELAYALRHSLAVEPWIESLFRDLSAPEPRSEADAAQPA